MQETIEMNVNQRIKKFVEKQELKKTKASFDKQVSQ